MQIRKAAAADADSIMQIFRQAQASLNAQGVNQWQNGYPNPEIVNLDILAGTAMVCLVNGRIGGAFTLSFNYELTYNDIFEGAWLSKGPYGVIHRMAVADNFKGQGVGEAMLQNAEHMCLSRGIHSIRIDTHKDNNPMQSLLNKDQFRYCGKIYLSDGQERLAFEKLF